MSFSVYRSCENARVASANSIAITVLPHFELEFGKNPYSGTSNDLLTTFTVGLFALRREVPCPVLPHQNSILHRGIRSRHPDVRVKPVVARGVVEDKIVFLILQRVAGATL